MTQYNTETTLNSLYREVYPSGVENLIPDNIKLLKMIKFSEQDKLGEKFTQPVMLTHEHGFSVGTGAFALNDHIASEASEAQVDGYQVLLRTAIGYDAADRMAGGKQSFVKWGDQLFMNMLQSMSKRLEVLQFYGRSSLGKVESISTGVITVSLASWAPGIWAGSKGAILNAYTATTSGTQHNGDLTITAVDLSARTITVSGTSAAVVAGDYLYWKGFYGADQFGLDAITTATGTIYNLNPSTYELWKGTSYDCGNAQLTVGKVLNASAYAAERGCEEEMVLAVNPRTWANLNADVAGAQVFDSSYSAAKTDAGTKEIHLNGQNGDIKVISSIYCKAGEGFLFPPKRLKRIGSTDVTFNRPGQSEKVFLELPSNAGFELRCRSSQTLFCERPAYMVKLTGIVNV